MADVFISYDSEDRAIAEKIARGLTSAGFSVWWDRHIQAGVRFKKEIQRQIDSARAVVVLWSAASTDSDWVGDEAQTALDANKLIPVRVDTTLPPLGFRQVQSLDLHGWNGDSQAGTFQALLSSLRRLLDDSTASMPLDAIHHHASTPNRTKAKTRWFVGAAVVIATSVLAFSLLQTRFANRASSDVNDGRVEIELFSHVTKTDELERFAKGFTDVVVRVLATSNIKTVTRKPGTGELNLASNPAEFALRGTVDRDADKLVVSAELSNTRDALVLWSTTMQRDAAQIRVLEDKFSSSVATVLRCALRLRRGAKNDPSTDLLSGLLGFCAAFVENRLDQLPELAGRVVEVAPRYALSYALRADSNAIVSNLDHLGVERSPQEVARLRKMVYDDARVAEEMDPSVDSYYARAIVADPSVGLTPRARFLQKSIEVDPDGFGLREYARLLHRVGRFHEALDYFERAASANPSDWPSSNDAAREMGCTGNMESARKRFDDLRKKHSDPYVDWMQFWTELWCGDPAIAKTISETYGTVWTGGGRMYIASDYPCGRAFLDDRVRGLQPTKSEIDTRCPEGDQDAYGYFGYVDAALAIWESNGSLAPVAWRETLFMPTNRLVRADPRFMPSRRSFRLGRLLARHRINGRTSARNDKLPYDCKEAALAARANALEMSVSSERAELVCHLDPVRAWISQRPVAPEVGAFGV